MRNTKAEEAMRELTLMLLYLSRFTQGEKFHEATHLSRSKSVYITESGMEQAKELLSKYGISDWKQG